MPPSVQPPIPFSPDDEQPEPDEEILFGKLARVMEAGGEAARDGDRKFGRRSHVKCLGALEGELVVADTLDSDLAQGLFERPGRYPVLARFSHLPAEALDDRAVSSVRGLALRVFDVPGEPMVGHSGGAQDFVLDTGKSFNVRGLRALLAAMSAVEATGPLPQGFKAAVSHGARAVNAALGSVGLGSANLDVLGHARLHPLGEAYFSQAALRWGRYAAKIGLFPADGDRDLPLEASGPDALREAVQRRCLDQALRFDLRAQLRTDRGEMPIEDAHEEWPEALSPYRTVATVHFPAQDALDPERVLRADHSAFSPGKGLEAHRPLGAIMRARMHVYRVLGAGREQG